MPDILTPKQVNSLEYVLDLRDSHEALRAERDAMKAALLSLGSAGCWCEVAIGNPMYQGQHNERCRRIAALMKRPEGGGQ